MSIKHFDGSASVGRDRMCEMMLDPEVSLGALQRALLCTPSDIAGALVNAPSNPADRRVLTALGLLRPLAGNKSSIDWVILAVDTTRLAPLSIWLGA